MKKILLSLFIGMFANAVNAQVSVTATAGTATATYTTVKAAFDAVNLGTHQGAITLSITASTTETATAVLNASGGTASYTSILVKPATGTTPTITGSNIVAIIKINGADNVTIDGSNNGTTTRDLTISNTYVAVAPNNPVVAWVASTATDGCVNVSFKNTNFAGSSASGTVGCVIVSGSTLAAAEVPNNNFSAINNTFVRAQNGLFCVGNATNTDTGWIIRNNVIGSTVAADKMLFRGIAVQNAKNFEVSGNTVTGVSLPATSTNTTQGILLGAAVTNGLVFNNKISDIKQPNTGGYGAAGLQLNSSSATANILVYNNVVNDVAGYGYAAGGGLADNGNGIVVSNGAGYKIYYNTVVMDTNQTIAGRPSAFNVISTVTAAGAIDLRNNIFVNNQTQAGDRYAIYSGAPNTVFSNINYNDYFSTGTNLGYIGANRPAFSDIQAGFGGNVNSLNISPVFVSATDFHISPTGNVALDNKAVAVAEVTLDIDGVTRNATTPDLGASEFTALLGTQNVTKTKINYYPNPVVDNIYLNTEDAINSVEVYNIMGQKVANQTINDTNGIVNLSNLASGNYIVKVITDKATQNIKIVKN